MLRLELIHESLNPFDSYLAIWSGRVDSALDRALALTGEGPGMLPEAMRYTVFAGGKRLRPVLCLLSAKAAGGTEEEAMPAACAVELAHAFSLVHDDLPAMDDDDLRRGKPTNHKVFGEAVSILAGDALLARAFEILCELTRREAVGPAVAALGEAIGGAGLIGGQILDLLGENRKPDLAQVRAIHSRKTGALFVGCVRLGAIAAGGTEEVSLRLIRYGEKMGLAFQIVDDVLDEIGQPAELGKSAGRDREEGKMTWPAAVGVDASIAEARRLAEAAREVVRGLPAGDLLAALADRVVDRTR